MFKRGELAAIQRLLTSGNNVVAAGPVWSHISDTLGIGSMAPNNQLIFTMPELLQLRAAVNEQVPGDIRHAKLNGNRTDIARDFVNEKLSSKSVFQNFVWGGARWPATVNLLEGIVSIPRGAYAAFPYTELDPDDSAPIIIVENGEALLLRSDFLLPNHLLSAMWVYRGHGVDARAVKSLIASVKGRRPIIGFFDYDPKGLCLANEFDVDALLLPAMWSTPSSKHPMVSPYIKKAEFAAQVEQLRTLLPALPKSTSVIAEAIIAGQWSLAQEHILAVGVPLVEVVLAQQNNP